MQSKKNGQFAELPVLFYTDLFLHHMHIQVVIGHFDAVFVERNFDLL